ncbi:MAG: ATP-binding cassette domain-containing protein [Planctomycetes bacterium]|nr:ATP-binding cassette domain-containing protein [Planctomycetota bacterium]
MISVSHLTRTYGSVKALDDVSFEVAKGEVVGLLGPNGAGKTTAMRILTGFLPATSGAVSVAGFDVMNRSLEVRRRIGYLPESVPLYRELRVEEMLGFHSRLHRMPRALARQRIPEVLELVGVRERSRDLVGNLSRGLRQRVGLAVALLPDPEVLILDEPTSGLDPLQRIEVRSILLDLAQKHTVLVSSHILPEIEAVCPRVIIVHKGRIAADGTRGELVARLAGGSHVRIEAVLGKDAGSAARLLGSIAGVSSVRDCGKAGIHQQFELVCETDLREEAGALASMRGWALRELSWRAPTLEQIFARFAIGQDEPLPVAAAPAAAPAAVHTAPERVEIDLGRATAVPASKAAPAPAPEKQIYSLNPFDRGAQRDLSRPVSKDDPPAPPAGPKPD